MTKQPPEMQEVHVLVSALFDRELCEAEEARLIELLEGSTDIQDLYVELMANDCLLRAEHVRSLVAIDDEVEGSSESENETPRSAQSPIIGFLGSVTQWAGDNLTKPTPLSLAVASCTLAIIIVAMSIVSLEHDRSPTAQKSPEVKPPVRTLVGWVTETDACVWAKGSVPRTRGEQLFEGDVLTLAEGTARVRFISQATAVLHGPAGLRLDAANAATLLAGRATADVPLEAVGFVINSGVVQLVDLGTQFAVQVGHGATFVHVFEGRVAVTPKGLDGNLMKDRSHILDAHESLKITASREMLIPKPDESKVVQRLPLPQAEPPPVTAGLLLWLAADGRVSIDREGRVSSWGDMLAGDNRTSQNAVQTDYRRRPLLVREAIGGKPALQFDGQQTFLETNDRQNTSDDQTLFIVFRRRVNPFGDVHSGQLLNARFDDGPRIVMHEMPEGHLQVKMRTASESVGRLNTKPIGVNVPVVCAYVYRHSTNRSELFVNGLSQDKGDAPKSVRGELSRVIGCHPSGVGYFYGDIAEILIYNTGLTADEIEQVGSYLAKKYSLTGLPSNSPLKK